MSPLPLITEHGIMVSQQAGTTKNTNEAQRFAALITPGTTRQNIADPSGASTSDEALFINTRLDKKKPA